MFQVFVSRWLGFTWPETLWLIPPWKSAVEDVRWFCGTWRPCSQKMGWTASMSRLIRATRKDMTTAVLRMTFHRWMNSTSGKPRRNPHQNHSKSPWRRLTIKRSALHSLQPEWSPPLKKGKILFNFSFNTKHYSFQISTFPFSVSFSVSYLSFYLVFEFCKRMTFSWWFVLIFISSFFKSEFISLPAQHFCPWMNGYNSVVQSSRQRTMSERKRHC